MKPTGFRNALFTCAALGQLAACTVGPDYHAPAAPAVALTPDALPAATASGAGPAQSFNPGADIAGQWWTLYHSPPLSALINAALTNNPTLAAARATLREEQENLRAGDAVFAPQISGSFSDTRSRESSAAIAAQGGGPAAARTVQSPLTLYNATISASYNLDIFGGNRRELEGLRAQVAYERDELEAAYLSLTANIVTAAVQEASLRAQIAAEQTVIADEQKLLGILQIQVQDGGIAQAQVLQQQAVLAQAQATLPPLESQLATTRDQLAAYVGLFPANYHAGSFTLSDLTLPTNLPVSIPSAIVAQRPDIAAAGELLHQATAEVGVTDANLLPNISLSADIGREALTPGALFTPQNILWSLVAGATAPIFEGGELLAKRQAAIAALQVSGAQYQSTVIAAFQTVADVLAALQYDAAEDSAAQDALSAAAASLSVTQSQYRLGGQPFSSVLTAETTYESAAITAAKASAARLSDTAALFQALGGGWWNRHDSAAEDKPPGLIP
jgi:NodT family efflux transporter outer membrane factor (OMF) lipoprotein